MDDKYKKMKEHRQFLNDIEDAIENADEPNADGFVFELYGRGSLLEQAHAYVMHTFAGRRPDRQFLIDASVLLKACFEKAHKDHRIRTDAASYMYYTINEVGTFDSDEKTSYLEISGAWPPFTVGRVSA